MSTNRYYNPPDEVRRIGRPLRPGGFSALQKQLIEGEVLLAVFTNQAPALVAAEVPTVDRFNELDRVWRPFEFYAVPKEQAERGFSRSSG